MAVKREQIKTVECKLVHHDAVKSELEKVALRPLLLVVPPLSRVLWNTFYFSASSSPDYGQLRPTYRTFATYGSLHFI